MLTADELKRIEERLEKATIGKWTAGINSKQEPAVFSSQCGIAITSPLILETNAEFIANSKNDITSLLSDRKEILKTAKKMADALLRTRTEPGIRLDDRTSDLVDKALRAWAEANR